MKRDKIFGTKDKYTNRYWWSTKATIISTSSLTKEAGDSTMDISSICTNRESKKNKCSCYILVMTVGRVCTKI